MNRTILLAVALFLLGCQAKPREQVFEAEGFRFVPPPGWSERARGEDSPSADGLLVQYKRLSAGHPAWLRISVAGRSPAAIQEKGWRSIGATEKADIGGFPATRSLAAGKWRQKDYLRETVVVSRGGRVYVFTAMYPAGDQRAEEQIRLSLAGVSWQDVTRVAER
jgi:hypothetical protein